MAYGVWCLKNEFWSTFLLLMKLIELVICYIWFYFWVGLYIYIYIWIFELFKLTAEALKES